jgi:LmbE family N-acetylglucosaminyl deacetylase
MKIVDPPAGGTIMVIAAHPDDMESWCSGTIAQAIRAGWQASLLLVTSGDAGSIDPGATRPSVAAVREEEARRAAELLGLSDVEFLRFPDGEVEDTHALRAMLVCWIRRWQPRTVFTHDPEHSYPPYLSHRDHRITGRVALDAIQLARDRLAFTEDEAAALPTHVVSEVWLFSSTVANSVVNITETINLKIDARLAHHSQTADPAQLRDAWRRRAREIGAPAGLAFAEAFTVLATS